MSGIQQYDTGNPIHNSYQEEADFSVYSDYYREKIARWNRWNK
jgi:hypothetical protein